MVLILLQRCGDEADSILIIPEMRCYEPMSRRALPEPHLEIHVSIAHIYLDESGTHRGSKYMTVAGYWFEERQAARFARDWEKVLAKFGLSHAHMTDCALGYGEYRKLTLAQRIQSEKLLIEGIKRRTRFGLAITIPAEMYDAAMKDVEGAPSCYTQCLMIIFHHISRFAAANGFAGSIRYIFEAGHQSQNEANQYLNAIPAHGPEWVAMTRYGGHEFSDKSMALPLQAADMLAWQTRHYHERLAQGHSKPRKDFVALARATDVQAVMDANAIQALRASLIELAPLVYEGDQLGAATKAKDIFQRYGLSLTPPPRVNF